MDTAYVYTENPSLLPEYKTPGASGCDVRANIGSPVTLGMLERVVIPTGLHFSLPEGCELQVRPRSGLAAKHGIVVVLGTVDNDYRGEVGVIVINCSKEPFTINPGERVGQLVIARYVRAELVPVLTVEELGATERGAKGFGSSGVK